MDTIDWNTPWQDRAFYFCGKLDPPVVAKVWRFRSEDKYDSDEQPELTALALVHRCVKCVGQRPFLLIASEPAPPTAMRSRKGVLWNCKALRNSPHIAIEVECDHGETRLAAIVDLSEFGFDSEASALLNWGRGLLVLAAESLERVRRIAEPWISPHGSDIFAFDFDTIGSSLRQNITCGVLRYFPPSAPRPETVVVVANASFVDEGACECIDSVVLHGG